MTKDEKIKNKDKPKEVKIKNRFKIKILKVLFLVTILPLVIISLNSLYTVIKTRRANISELQMLAIDNASEKIEKFFRDQAVSLALSTTENDIRKLDIKDIEDLVDTIKMKDEVLKKALNLRENTIIEMAMIDNNGYEIMNLSKKVLKYVRNEPYFDAVVKEATIYFSEVIYNNGQASILLSGPLTNRNHEIIGVVATTINLGPIIDIMSTAKVGNTGFVYIVDKQGNVISSSNNSFAKTGDSLKDIYLVRSVMGGNTHNGLGKNDAYTNLLNEDVIFTGRSLNAGKKEAERMVDWFVFSEWPEDDAFSVINNLINRSIIIIFVSFIFAVILGLFLVRQIVRPIEALFKGTEQITQGNLNHRVNLNTGDEFEALGENFNKMIKVLKENEKLKEEFVFIAAHELRTPVTAIRGYLQMTLTGTFGQVSEAVKENLEIINKANERLVQLVQDLLEVARSDAGRMEINMKPTAISENIKNTIDQIRSLADEKNIKINYKLPEAGVGVMADDYKLNEVLTNLIGNAIKYTSGNGSVDIWHEDRGGFLATYVKDHGIGMSKENMAKLFSKFYRIQTDETREIEGTGLGLYVCQQIIDRMEGKIKVQSEVGKGSTFHFLLKKVKI